MKTYKNKLIILLLSALVLRIILAPWSAGDDLKYFMEICDNWLTKGLSPYNNTIPYPYTPIYMYFLSLMKIISGNNEHIQILVAKLPQIIADVGIGWIIAELSFKHLDNHRHALFAAAAYLFNPLVLYNAAFYGRFDQLASFFAVAGYAAYAAPFGSSVLLALGFCTKTYPLFLTPFFLVKDFKRFILSAVVFTAILAVLTIPLMLAYHNPAQSFKTMFGMVAHRPQGLSWQVALYKYFDVSVMIKISEALLLTYFAILIFFPKKDFLSHAALAVTLFPLFSKLAWDQYITWAIPFLLLDFVINRKRHALFFMVFLTFLGCICNAHFNLTTMVGLPQNFFNVFYALTLTSYGVIEFLWIRRAGGKIPFLNGLFPETYRRRRFCK